MPTPAIDQFTSQYWPKYTTYIGGIPYPPETNVVPVRVKGLKRPASYSNPVRADKTRGPGNWSVRANKGWFDQGEVMLRYQQTQIRTHITGCVLAQTSMEDYIRDPNMEEALKLLSNARLAALSSATESAKQLNAALAQANSTAKMVGRAASSFANGLDNLMAGPGGLAQKAGKMANWRNLPSRYLEYLYGWAPLGDDLANAFDKLAEFRDRGFAYSMILKSKKQFRSECRINLQTYGGGLGTWANAQISGTRYNFARCGYRFDLPQWFMDQTPVIAPFSTAYELTRLSFVLDWFVPIGNWVGAMEAAQFSPFFYEGWELYGTRETYLTAEIPSYISPTTYGVEFGHAEGSFEIFEMVRRRIGAAPLLPQLPALKPFPGLQQAAQGLSLLTQAFQRWR